MVTSLAKDAVTSKLIGETAASMFGGEGLNKVTKDITGDSWGRNVAGLFGDKWRNLHCILYFISLF